MNFIEYKGNNIAYELKRKDRKTISIRVTPEGKVEVSAPLNLDDSIISEILIKRAEWIVQRQSIREQMPAKRKLEAGARISYMGEEILIRPIKWIKKSTVVELCKGELRIFGGAANLQEEQFIKGALRAWYMNRARGIFAERVEKYSKIMGMYPNEIRVKAQKTLWGSCSSQNNLNFNYKLLLAPLEVLDYVVVHELCHIRHKNHSQAFWNEVQRYMPDFREKKDWLEKYGHTLEILEEQL